MPIQPLPVSRLAEAPEQSERVIGAALITGAAKQPPLLDMLFVSPPWQRMGVATSLVSAALSELLACGEEKLESRFMLGNEKSEAWHRPFGFTEVPDLFLAQASCRDAEYEIWRHTKLGRPTNLLRRLESKLERFQNLVAELEAKAELDGIESVVPTLRRR